MMARTVQDQETPLHEEAAALVLSEDQGVAAEAFAARSELHRRALADARSALERLDALRDDHAFAGLRLEALRARPPARRPVAWSLAAGLAAVAVVVGLVHLPWMGRASGPAQTAEAQPLYRTDRGERRTLDLADGSQVVMDASSAVRVRYGPFSRSLDLLSGQALFRVAKHQLRPFRVYAGGERVTATGTVFDVRYDPGDVSVVLIEGHVRVQTRASEDFPGTVQTLVLSPGQAVDRRRDMLSVTRVDVRRAGSWSSGVLDLDGETLADAAAEMNRYASHPLRIEGAAARALTVGGVFTPGDTERFARTMTEVFPLALRHGPDGAIILSQRPS